MRIFVTMRRFVTASMIAWVGWGCGQDSAPPRTPQTDLRPAKAPSREAEAVAKAPAVAAPAQPKSLDALLPDELDGLQRKRLPGMDSEPGHAHGAYMADSGRAININLHEVADLPFERGQFHGLAEGAVQKNEAAHLEFEGHRIAGHSVERIYYESDSQKSEAKAMFSDALVLTVSVQPTTDRNAAVEIMKKLDLASIDAFAKAL